MTSAVGVLAVAMMAACGGGEPAETGMAADSATATPPAEQGGMQMEHADLPAGVTEAMVAEGKTIFEGAGLCSSCHQVDGTGGPLAPNLTDDEWLNITSRNYDEMVALVTSGVATPKQFPGAMPAKGGSAITDEQVRSVAAYVYTLSGN
jgi:mono/diheme cytochrome c family protein